jgi:putative transposase
VSRGSESVLGLVYRLVEASDGVDLHAKWTYYQLHVILDVYSHYLPGWMVATRESAILAERFIEATAAKQAIVPDSLTIHADRGSSMTSK